MEYIIKTMKYFHKVFNCETVKKKSFSYYFRGIDWEDGGGMNILQGLKLDKTKFSLSFLILLSKKIIGLVSHFIFGG